MKEWREMSEFCPPSPRKFNSDQDHTQWYWVTFGDGKSHLCRFEKHGTFVPVAGGMVMGNPKLWMPLELPVAPILQR